MKVSKTADYHNRLGGLQSKPGWVPAPSVLMTLNQGWGPRICILKFPGDCDDGKHSVFNRKLEWNQITEGLKYHGKNPLFSLAPPKLLKQGFKTNCQVKGI